MDNARVMHKMYHTVVAVAPSEMIQSVVKYLPILFGVISINWHVLVLGVSVTFTYKVLFEKSPFVQNNGLYERNASIISYFARMTL